ncbi:hypothetical protein T484DRAFT_1885465, partial [Baffinella frigidus]
MGGQVAYGAKHALFLCRKDPAGDEPWTEVRAVGDNERGQLGNASRRTIQGRSTVLPFFKKPAQGEDLVPLLSGSDHASVRSLVPDGSLADCEAVRAGDCILGWSTDAGSSLVTDRAQEAADDPLEVLGLMERDALGAWVAWEKREEGRRTALRTIQDEMGALYQEANALQLPTGGGHHGGHGASRAGGSRAGGGGGGGGNAALGRVLEDKEEDGKRGKRLRAAEEGLDRREASALAHLEGKVTSAKNAASFMTLGVWSDLLHIKRKTVQHAEAKSRSVELPPEPITSAGEVVPHEEAQKRGMRTLHMEVVGARNLPKKDFFGRCDPFCVITYNGATVQTKTKKNTYTPEWRETFSFHVDAGAPETEMITAVVMDWDRFTDDDLVGAAHDDKVEGVPSVEIKHDGVPSGARSLTLKRDRGDGLLPVQGRNRKDAQLCISWISRPNNDAKTPTAPASAPPSRTASGLPENSTDDKKEDAEDTGIEGVVSGPDGRSGAVQDTLPPVLMRADIMAVTGWYEKCGASLGGAPLLFRFRPASRGASGKLVRGRYEVGSTHVAPQPVQYFPTGAMVHGANCTFEMPGGVEELRVEAYALPEPGQEVLVGETGISVATLVSSKGGLCVLDLPLLQDPPLSSLPLCGPLRAVVRVWIPGEEGMGASTMVLFLASAWDDQLERWKCAQLVRVANEERDQLAQVTADTEQEAHALMVPTFRDGRVVQETAATRIAEVKEDARLEGLEHWRRGELAANMVLQRARERQRDEARRGDGAVADAVMDQASIDAKGYQVEALHKFLAADQEGANRAAEVEDLQFQHLQLLKWASTARLSEIRANARDLRIQIKVAGQWRRATVLKKIKRSTQEGASEARRVQEEADPGITALRETLEQERGVLHKNADDERDEWRRVHAESEEAGGDAGGIGGGSAGGGGVDGGDTGGGGTSDVVADAAGPRL